jgi:hypothetical protein
MTSSNITAAVFGIAAQASGLARACLLKITRWARRVPGPKNCEDTDHGIYRFGQLRPRLAAPGSEAGRDVSFAEHAGGTRRRNSLPSQCRVRAPGRQRRICRLSAPSPARSWLYGRR